MDFKKVKVFLKSKIYIKRKLKFHYYIIHCHFNVNVHPVFSSNLEMHKYKNNKFGGIVH